MANQQQVKRIPPGGGIAAVMQKGGKQHDVERDRADSPPGRPGRPQNHVQQQPPGGDERQPGDRDIGRRRLGGQHGQPQRVDKQQGIDEHPADRLLGFAAAHRGQRRTEPAQPGQRRHQADSGRRQDLERH